MAKEQEMSKEWIKAEMEDLKSAADTRLSISYIFFLSGFGSIFVSLMVIGYPPFLSISVLFLIIGIVAVLIGFILLKSWREKRRRYNE